MSERGGRISRPGRRLRTWHGGWAACLALIGLCAAALGALPGAAERMALVVMILPGLVGLIPRRPRRKGQGLLIMVAWMAAACSASALTGGMGGAMTGLLAAPIGAGLLIGGSRRAVAGAVAGAAATASAVLVGLASVWLSGPPSAAPGLSTIFALVGLTGLLVALVWAWKPRERALAKAEDARRRALNLLEVQPGLTMVLDASGQVLATHGMPPPALAARALTDHGLFAAVHAPDRPAVIDLLQRAAARPAGDQPLQATFAPRLALDRRVRLLVRRLDEPGVDVRLIGLALDDTPQFAREHALEDARVEAEASNAGKSRFLANMSHELRTPLNAVIGFSDIMRTRLFGPIPDRYAEYAESIHQAGGHLLALINDVLDVSKIEARRYELSIERFDARDAVSTAAAMVRLAADDRRVALSAVLPTEPAMVSADKRALQQIALNLLSNAIKFTPAGGSVTAALEIVGPYLELVVADTGVGIAPEDVKRLGRPFEQAGDADQKARGTGLGLSLVRSLAELHGGRMSIESTLGEGTAITVRLPVAASAAIEPDAASDIALNATSPASGGAEIIPLRPNPSAQI